MVFEVTRHGARGSLNTEYFNSTFWPRGELTQVGKRQHYLIGQQVRDKYIKEKKLLSERYNPKEVLVRSTNMNRTIESALSQLVGLY